ncbi:hypothetical protein D9M68_773010 [compost metagenome]
MQQQVDGQTLDARHGGDCLAAVVTVQDEHRQDQVVDAQAILAYQATGEIVAAIAAQAGGGKQAMTHGRLQSPHIRASVTVISGHYDQLMTAVYPTATVGRSGSACSRATLWPPRRLFVERGAVFRSSPRE